MDRKQGCLSIESENIFPIIKKWLYTEQDIFFRELISNAADAITKLKKLIEIKECNPITEPSKIEIILNEKEKTIKFIDNGIGMTPEEIDQYINLIAFSGANDFLKKYAGKTNDDQIIGHFGLGFYSAFMVAEKVTINSLSWQKDAKPVYWECNNEMKFAMSQGHKQQRGTEITLYLNTNYHYLQPKRTHAIIEKYFQFFPIDISLSYIGNDNDDKNSYGTCLVNNIKPLWANRPDKCTHEDYIEFYHKVFKDHDAPLFWIHLYEEELGIKGILFFRNMRNPAKAIDGTVRLYNNQVFVADNTKEVVPDFILLQNGILDCKNLPLLVSRSALQCDDYVNAVSNYLTEQVAYKLYGMFTCEREYYEQFWPDLNPFIKYGCLKNKLFSSLMTKCVIFQTIHNRYVTLKEHLATIKAEHENEVFYVSDEVQQAPYINMFKNAGIDALILTHVIDQPLIRKLEMIHQELHFNRIDSDFSNILKVNLTKQQEAELAKDEQIIKELFSKLSLKNDISLKAEKLKNPEIASIITLDEKSRRIRDTVEFYGATGINLDALDCAKETLLLNINNILIQFLIENPGHEITDIFCRQLYDLACLGQEKLEAEEMAEFIIRSNKIMGLLCQYMNLQSLNESRIFSKFTKSTEVQDEQT